MSRSSIPFALRSACAASKFPTETAKWLRPGSFVFRPYLAASLAGTSSSMLPAPRRTKNVGGSFLLS